MSQGRKVTPEVEERIKYLYSMLGNKARVAAAVKLDKATVRHILKGKPSRKEYSNNGFFDWRDFNNSIIN